MQTNPPSFSVRGENTRLFTGKQWFESQWGDGKSRGELFLTLLKSHGYDIAAKSILEIGCGYGGVALVMATNSRYTVSMDIDKEMIIHTNKRIHTDRFSSLLGNGHSLPLKDSCVDIVLLIGVFEFIPACSPHADPEKIHLETLQDVMRVLSPNGVLVLALENRYWLQYWMGLKDFHSGLRFVTVLPRKLADFVSRTLKNRNYLERLYSDSELNRLLEKSGFHVHGKYTALPGWLYMDRLSNLDLPDDFNTKIDAVKYWSPFAYGIKYNLNFLPKTFWKALNKLGLLKLFCSNFIYVAKRT